MIPNPFSESDRYFMREQKRLRAEAAQRGPCRACLWFALGCTFVVGFLLGIWIH